MHAASLLQAEAIANEVLSSVAAGTLDTLPAASTLCTAAVQLAASARTAAACEVAAAACCILRAGVVAASDSASSNAHEDWALACHRAAHVRALELRAHLLAALARQTETAEAGMQVAANDTASDSHTSVQETLARQVARVLREAEKAICAGSFDGNSEEVSVWGALVVRCLCHSDVSARVLSGATEAIRRSQCPSVAQVWLLARVHDAAKRSSAAGGAAIAEQIREEVAQRWNARAVGDDAAWACAVSGTGLRCVLRE